MFEFLVLYSALGSTESQEFYTYAEDEDDAIEKCEAAHPGCLILATDIQDH